MASTIVKGASAFFSEAAAIEWARPSLWLSALFIAFNPLLWNVLGRAQYRKQAVSRALRCSPRVACYLFAVLIFSLGLYRDHLYAVAVREQPRTQLFPALVVNGLGPLLIAAGHVLVLSSIYKLGIIGTYLGDYFGILHPHKIVSFPFTVSSDPMYDGSTMIFAGYALWSRSIAGVLLSALVALTYSVAIRFESKFTAMIYGGRPDVSLKKGKRA